MSAVLNKVIGATATTAAKVVPTGAFRFFSQASHPQPLSKEELINRIKLQASQKKTAEKLAKIVSSAARTIDAEMVGYGDTETTGLKPDQYGAHRIVSAALLVKGKQSKEVLAKEFIVNPGRPCDPAATRTHGLKAEVLAEAPPFAAIGDDFFATLSQIEDSPIWFHNLPFDRRMLQREIDLAPSPTEWQLPDAQLCCSLQLARIIRPVRHYSNTLDTLCEIYGVDLQQRQQQGHSASLDIELLSQVVPKLADDVLSFTRQAGVLDELLALHQENSLEQKPTLDRGASI
jgi:DNA polymerase-3 subunit epsilon